MSSFDSSAYINSEALLSWKTHMDSINADCINQLNSFKNDAQKLSGVWDGNASDAYIKRVDEYMNVAKIMHESMKDIERFLENVVNVSKNQ